MKNTDYGSIAKEIVEKAGGRGNIVSAGHCSTRLRLVIADHSKCNKEKIENIENIQGVFEASGQLQIVFGDGNVNRVYKEVNELLVKKNTTYNKKNSDKTVCNGKYKDDDLGMQDNSENDIKIIYSPLKGKAVSLSVVPDAAFANEILGMGIAVIPADGLVVSPVDGEVVSLFDVLHAICIRGDNGVEILIHIGINTVELQGKFYKSLVKVGDRLRVGQPILDVDIEGVRNAGYNIISPIIVTNSDEYEKVERILDGEVERKEQILKIK